MRQRRPWARALPSSAAEVACRAVPRGIRGEGMQTGPRDAEGKGMPCSSQPQATNTAWFGLSRGLQEGRPARCPRGPTGATEGLQRLEKGVKASPGATLLRCPTGGCGGDKEARGRGKHRIRAGSTKDAGPGRAGRGLRWRGAHTKAAGGRARYSQGERALSMPAAQGSGRERRARPRSGAGVRSRGLFALGRGPRWGGGRQAALLLRAAPSGRAAAGPRSRVLLPAPRASAPARAPTKSAGRAGLPFVPPSQGHRAGRDQTRPPGCA